MKILKWLIIIVLIPVALFGLFLLYSTLTDFKPEEKIVLLENNEIMEVSDTISFSFLTWNMGYAGLDKTMDFFYDGGEKVRPTKEQSLQNLDGLVNTLEEYSDFDFLFLQEVDVYSKRSYGINQLERISNAFPSHFSSFAANYKVNFVPLPPSNPMGRVNSGIAIFSKYQCKQSIRYSFPGNYNWPMSIFMLDRCFLVNEYPLSNGKSLIVINTHNSAYDDGSLRKQQMGFLRDVLLEYYEQGNYVIAGGDWNQCPAGFEPNFDSEVFDTDELIYTDPVYPAEGWKWAYDASFPTNRRVIIPYEKGKTATTMIDYFLLSPNIELESVNGRDLGFEFTDHQPVEIHIKLVQ